MPRATTITTSARPAVVLKRLRTSRAFVFDMDGTLVLGDKTNHHLNPLPGALEITRWLSDRRVPFVLFTNGTAHTPQQYVGMLRDVGFPLPDNGVMTPASCAADLFRRCRYRRILTLGGEGLERPLRDAGRVIVRPEGKPVADAILVGWFREFTMGALEAACFAAWNGAKVFSCSQSLFFATAEGKALGTSRAISAMIKDLTGARIHVIGKPALEALRCAARQLGARTTELTWSATILHWKFRWPFVVVRWLWLSTPVWAQLTSVPICRRNNDFILRYTTWGNFSRFIKDTDEYRRTHRY
jgi:4-nitrophenyl phosphatase